MGKRKNTVAAVPTGTESEATPNQTAAVKVRMYNMGFGDCFLLKFPFPDRWRTVLIDCGKHVHSRCPPKLPDVVEQLQRDLTGSDGKRRIDVLVVTHRHRDHVSGFALDSWNQFEVGEVWMPWTENPEDSLARDICERQSRRALQLLDETIPLLGLNSDQTEYLAGFAGNNLTNAAAMKRLHQGFLGSPLRRFFPEIGSEPGAISTEQLPGVSVYVLGPSRNEQVIRDMEPPRAEAFFRATQGPGNGSLRLTPFSDRWVLNRADYAKWYIENGWPDPIADFTDATAAHIGRFSDDPGAELAATLEKSVNGTSLVLVFEIGRAVLLFPGDAQWGTWNEILQNPQWQRLLKRVTFYKVGHHGSHNATPRRFVEDYLTEGTVAMMPTDAIEQWPMIPKPELVTRLHEKKVKFVRSDTKDDADAECFNRFRDANGDTVYIDVDVPC